jgi:hypothetical protein
MVRNFQLFLQVFLADTIDQSEVGRAAARQAFAS